MKYCVEVCCMRYGNVRVEAATKEEALEKARKLFDHRHIDWCDEEIKQMNVEEEYRRER